MEFIEVVGYCAAFFTTLAFLPQAIKVIKTQDTSSLSLIMYVVFNIGVCLWLLYGILREDSAIIAANTITLMLSLTILAVKIRNELKAKAHPAATTPL